MFSLRTVAARAARPSICTRCLRLTRSSRPLSTLLLSSSKTNHTSNLIPPLHHYRNTFAPSSARRYSAKSQADEILEQIQDQYSTARDEYEIAFEETEKNTVYAEDDREAARDELDRLKEMFAEACERGEGVGDEVRRRVGERVRELEEAVKAMESSADADDNVEKEEDGEEIK